MDLVFFQNGGHAPHKDYGREGKPVTKRILRYEALETTQLPCTDIEPQLPWNRRKKSRLGHLDQMIILFKPIEDYLNQIKYVSNLFVVNLVKRFGWDILPFKRKKVIGKIFQMGSLKTKHYDWFRILSLLWKNRIISLLL